MPWKNQGGGPWGSGPRGPWGSGPQPVGPRPPDLEDLLRRGLTLFTRVRRNMKSLPLSLQDKALLNAQNMADIGHIKGFSSLNLSKHRSVINAFPSVPMMMRHRPPGSLDLRA